MRKRDISYMLEMMRTTVKLKIARLARRAAPRRFLRRQDGSAAVEFAAILLPFLVIMFGIMETALVFFADQTLQTAVGDSARLIMTGQAQAGAGGPWPVDRFKTEVCNRIYALFDCQGGISINVTKYSSFGSVTMAPPPIKNDGTVDTSNFNYDTGGPGDIVVVQLYYHWPLFMTSWGFSHLSNSSATNSRLLVAAAAFKNEPYQ
jgi:Flp pilus assembly protein TadG